MTSAVPPSIPPDPTAPAEVAAAAVGDVRPAAVAAPVAPPIGHTAARGAVWMAAQTVLSKFAGIAGQLVLAWLLAREDFGLVSLAYAWTALPSVIQQIGAREV